MSCALQAWHRAYLVELEQALQAADRALGNDGRIAVPYWDFTDIDGPEVGLLCKYI